MKRELPQVGAPDPELNTSPIIDEAEYDEAAASPDLELEAGACYFNGEVFPIKATSGPRRNIFALANGTGRR